MNHIGTDQVDWQGVFITGRDGKTPSVFGLGKMLGSQNRRVRGEYRLDGDLNRKGVMEWKLSESK